LVHKYSPFRKKYENIDKMFLLYIIILIE